MDWWQVCILAIIQGVTEFLPISSSAHLILPSQLLQWPDQGLAFDVAVHLGSLMAVLYFFRQRLLVLLTSCYQVVRIRQMNTDALLVLQVGLAVLPAVLVGGLWGSWVEIHLRSVLVIAITTIGFGVLLGLADYMGRRDRSLLQMTWQLALIIGIAQAFALIPGTSRSGVTITAALLLGFTRQASAEFSFLLSIPSILAAGSLQGFELLRSPLSVQWSLLLVATGCAAVSAYMCIRAFMRLIDCIGMWPFVWYRLGLGAVLLMM